MTAADKIAVENLNENVMTMNLNLTARFLGSILVVLMHREFLRADAPIDFEKQIRPILMEHCGDCHGEESREGGLRLTNRNDAFLLADSGRHAIVAGDVEQSELIRRLRSTDQRIRMPLDADPLSSDQMRLLEAWIHQGANWPATKAKSSKHWALPCPPKSSFAGCRRTFVAQE